LISECCCTILIYIKAKGLIVNLKWDYAHRKEIGLFII
jgi:hypothetical protein